MQVQEQFANLRTTAMAITAGVYLLVLCGHLLLPAGESFALFLAIMMSTCAVAVARLSLPGKPTFLGFGVSAGGSLASSFDPELAAFAKNANRAESDRAELSQLEVELAVLETQLHRDAMALGIPVAVEQTELSWYGPGAAASG